MSFLNNWDQIEEYYKLREVPLFISPKLNPSEDALYQHFGRLPPYKDAAHLNSIDIKLNCRASQNTIDIWHLSGKSQQEFIQTSLINFEQHSKSIYSSFAGYLPQFTRSFYSPLQLYLSNEPRPNLLLGDVNNLIQTILEIIQELQRQHVEPHRNIHIDLECVYQYNINTKSRDKSNLIALGNDLEVDPIFKYKEPVQEDGSKTDEAVKDSLVRSKIPPAVSTDDEKMDAAKGKLYDLEREGGMKRILRELLVAINQSYHHYVLELNGSNLKSYELSTIIPRCSIDYSPVCKILNTVNRMKESKCAEDEGLITISFHKYSDHLCLYLFCRDTEDKIHRKIHGQRIFLKELTTVLVQLFKNQVITKETESFLNRIQLKEDKDFTKFADFLQEKKEDVVQQDNDDISAKLNEFVYRFNEVRFIPKQISGDALTRCFRENEMNYADFKDLRVNLKRYGIKAGPVRKLWRFLNPVEVNEDEQDDENVVVIAIGSSDIDLSFENNDLYIDLFPK